MASQEPIQNVPRHVAKGYKTKSFNPSEVHVPHYEQLRLKKLKSNAEMMAAMGHGSLANDIWTKKRHEIVSQSLLDSMSEDELSIMSDDSDADDDSSFIGDKDPFDQFGVEGEENISKITRLHKANESKKRMVDIKKKVMCQKQLKKAQFQGLSMAESKLLRTQKKANQEQSAKEQPEEEQLVRKNCVDQRTQGRDEQRTELPATNQKQRRSSGMKKPEKAFCRPGSIGSFAKLHTTNLQLTKNLNSMETNVSREVALENVVDDNVRQDAALVSPKEDDSLVNSMEDNAMHHSHATPAENEKEPQAELSAVIPPKKKRRGPTLMAHVYARKPEERPMIVLNSHGQPVGPTAAIVKEFGRFLGTLARNSHIAPLNVETWEWMPDGTTNKIWDYVLRSYKVPEEGKRWVDAAVNGLWRQHKSRIKKKHYYGYDTDEERWENRPDSVGEDHFLELLDYWDLTVTQQQKNPDNQPPSQAQVYQESRKRVSGRVYKTSFETIKKHLDKMSELEAEYEHEENGHSKDPYYEAMNRDEHTGRIRLRGRGVTHASLKRSAKSDYIFPEVFLQSIKSNLLSEIGHVVAKSILSQVQAANPGINLVIPEFHKGVKASAGHSSHEDGTQAGQSSVGTTSNQVVEEPDAEDA